LLDRGPLARQLITRRIDQAVSDAAADVEQANRQVIESEPTNGDETCDGRGRRGVGVEHREQLEPALRVVAGIDLLPDDERRLVRRRVHHGVVDHERRPHVRHALLPPVYEVVRPGWTDRRIRREVLVELWRIRGQRRSVLRQQRHERIGGPHAGPVIVRRHGRGSASLVVRHQTHQVAAQALVRLRLGVRRGPVHARNERLHRRRGQLEVAVARLAAPQTLVLGPIELDGGHVGWCRRLTEHARPARLARANGMELERASDDRLASCAYGHHPDDRHVARVISLDEPDDYLSAVGCAKQ